MMSINYSLIVEKNNKQLQLALTANDGLHANAQAIDIARAFKSDAFTLRNEQTNICYLSKLFKKLAYNEFNYKNCEIWNKSFCNNTPVIYVLGTKFYVRPLILNYLDIPSDTYVRPSCHKKNCVNPFHNTYKNEKASKLTSADRQLALVFAGQGVPVKEIAKAFKVHRSTIYRLIHV
jgi:hypothetical protein